MSSQAFLLWLYGRAEDSFHFTRSRHFHFPSTRAGRLGFGPLSAPVRDALLQAGLAPLALRHEPDSSWRV
eukprot:6050440-Alexandrium_andersonii.AAC.2